jgi:nitroreductase
MELLSIIKERRSVRQFEDRVIPGNVQDMLIEALIWAPSAGNLQARHFFFVKDMKVKDGLVKAALGQKFIAGAPLVVVGCTDRRIENRYGDRGIMLYSIQDVSISIMNMMLLAHSLGLGTCWVGAFNEADVFETLDMPNHLRPVAIVPMGYPARMPKAPSRVTKEEAVTFV